MKDNSRSDTVARELVEAALALQSRQAALLANQPDRAAVLLSTACGHLGAARQANDPDGRITTVHDLCTAFAAYLPTSGKTLALHLVAWDLRAWPQQNQGSRP